MKRSFMKKRTLIVIAIGMIILIFIAYFKEYGEKTFFQALRIKVEQFINSDLYSLKYDDKISTKIEDEKLDSLTDYLSKYKLQRLSDEEFNESFTPQERTPTILSEKYFIDVYEDFIMIGIIKDSMKFYKVIEGKEYFEHIKILLEE